MRSGRNKRDLNVVWGHHLPITRRRVVDRSSILVNDFVLGFGFRTEGSCFRLGLTVEGSELKVKGLGFMTSGLGFRVQGLGFGVWNSKSAD